MARDQRSDETLALLEDRRDERVDVRVADREHGLLQVAHLRRVERDAELDERERQVVAHRLELLVARDPAHGAQYALGLDELGAEHDPLVRLRDRILEEPPAV